MKTAPNRALWPLLAVLCLMIAVTLWLPRRSTMVSESPAEPKTTKRVKFTSEKPKPLPEIDVRRKGGPSSSPTADRAEAFATLKREKPMLQAQFDEISGAPSYLQETGNFLTGKNPGKAAKEVVKDYVSRFPGLFGHDGAALDKARVTREDVTAHNGMTTLVWQQQHEGIPLYNTIFKANVTQDGEVIMVSDHFLANAATATGGQDTNPGITVAQAISMAAAGLGDAVPPPAVQAVGMPSGAEQKQRFTAEKLSDTTAHLTWLPLSAAEMRLAWDVTTFSLQRGEMYQTIVDAESGELLYRRSLTSDISDATYRVYTTESPSPFSPGHEMPSSLQPAYVNRVLLTTPAMNTTASPNGWINDGSMETNGNNVDAHTDIDNNNSPDLPRPNGGAGRVFDFPMDLTQAPSTYKDASVTQLFYWCNFMHDRMYEMGFTESSGNFQVNNFGRGGLGNDPVQADAQDGSGTDNANFSTPADGGSGRMQMYLWTGPNPDRDGSFEAEVVLHEYGHGVSNRLVGGGVGISALSSRGMGEGWSDFYGLALTAEAGDNPHGNWARAGYSRYQTSGWYSENYYYGARRYSYSTDMLKNPHTLKDIDPTQVDWHTNVPRNPTFAATQDATQVHYQGTVWCSMLWDMRTNLILKHGFAIGNDRAIRLVTDGMKLSPVNPNFIQARDGIIQATLVSFPADLGEVWTAFAKRGAGSGATAPASSTTTGIVESYAVPDDLQLNDRSGWNIAGNKGGPFTPAAKVITLSNSGSSMVSWSVNTGAAWLSASPASGTLAAGANVAVTLTTQADAVAPGFHSTNVVFSNTGSAFNQPVGVRLYVTPPVVQTFSLDSDPGWTRTGEWAFGTPSGGGGGTGNPDPTGGATGVNVFGVNLSGNHATTVTGPHFLTSGVVDLSLYAKTRLRFKRWLNTNSLTNSRVTVEVTKDGTNWREVYVNPGTTVTDNAWQTLEYDISSIADLQSAVQVRWSYQTIVANAYSGWNIDDVEFLGEATNSFTITAANSAMEGDAPVTATLTMSIAQASPVTVTLTSSNVTAATVPASVSLAAGETSTTFQITPVDDLLVDGTQLAVITATAPNVGPGIKPFSVLDNETATLTLSLPASVTEGGVAGAGTVTRSVVSTSAVTVALASSDPTAATVPDTVIIPPNQASVTFAIQPVNDTKIDGTQTTTISANVTGWTGASGSVDVLDNETLSLTVTAPSSVTEGGTGTGSVSISGTLTTPLTVSLSSNQAKLTVPATVTIAAGATSANFTATAPNDALAEANVIATITAGASGFTGGSGSTTVIDNDLSSFGFATITSPKTLSSPFNITITARNVSGSTVTGFTGTVNLSGTGTSGSVAISPAVTTAFTAGVWTGSVTLNTATTNIVLTANDGAGHTGTSNSFTVGVGSLHHFAFSNITSPKTAGAPFSTTITAQDIANNTVKSFASTVTFSVPSARTVGTGTSSTTALPLYTLYHDQRTQCIYLQGEIGGATTIRGLTLNVTTTPGQTMNNWTIRMKHTSLSSYATNAWENTGWTTVYQANETISTTGLKTFTFATPFAYDGTSNLMVDFSFNNSSWTSAGGVTFTTANANRTIYAYTDSGFGDPLTWNGTGSPTPTATTTLPNLLLETGSSNTITPTTSGTFAAGVWTGNLSIGQRGSQTAIQALNGTTIRGYSNDFSVNTTVAANPQSVTIPYNTPTAVILTGQDSAAPGAVLTYGVATNPTNGVLSGSAPNLTYTPNPGYQGADSFTFTAANGANVSFPATVSLTVQPPPPEIVVEQPAGTNLVDGGTVDYGTIPTGIGTARTFTIRNTGTMDLTVSGITKDGPNSAELTIGSLSSSTIAAGSSAVFTVTYTPAAAGGRTAAIHILNNDSDEASFDLTLTATGNVAFPDIALEQPAGTSRPDEASIVDFGLNVLGSPLVKTFTIRNTGSTDLSLSGVTIDGSGSSSFSAGAFSAPTVPVGGMVSFDVTFLPTSSGVKLAALHVLNNDPDEGSYDIDLHGIGGIAAGPIMLAKDINATANGGTLTNFVTSGGNVFYLQGLSLCRTNGTAAGTTTITGSGFTTSASSVAAIGTNVFFVGTDGTAGGELWSYNGTTAARLADINPGVLSSSPALLTVVGTTLYFTATSAANGLELWKSDGTAAGTVLVKDIVTGTTGSSPSNLTNVNGTLFFTANDGVNGVELWKSDGTSAGTVMVSNINAGSASSSPANLTAIGSTVYFSASNGTTTGLNGTELWKSDGTTTSLVLDINTGTASSSPAGLYNAGGILYFRASTTAAGTELYKSDGTSGGTVLVKDIFAGTLSSTPSNFTLAGSTLFFTATDSTANGVELWKTDGTSAGTVMVKNVNATTNGSSSPSVLTAVGSTLFFTATDGVNGIELWKSDGSSAGTVMVEDIAAGSAGSLITAMINYSGTLLCGASDGVTGQELWRSDGTASGTYRLVDALAGTASSSPGGLVALGGQLLFSALDGLTGTELWKSDGSTIGTSQVKDILAGANSSSPANFAVVNSTLYFAANEGTNGIELWKSDGTNAGTVMVANINPIAGTSSSPTLLRNVAGTLFFTATDTTANGQELWKSDGTGAGTVMVKNINPTTNASSSISGSVAVGSLLYFSANDGTNGAELWVSDGTTAGTVMVKNINPAASAGSSPANIIQVGTTVFFTANDGTSGIELWATDGSDAGTVLVKDINPGTGTALPANLAAYNGVLYFSASDGVNGTELWRSDGTNAGTFMLKDINSGVSGSGPANFRVHNGVLYFAAFDSFGTEVWRTDGTSSGTYQVLDLSPGSSSSFPANLTSVGAHLYFTATHPNYGIELWRTDGTAAGTQLLADLNPGTNSSSPSQLTAAGGRLFFTATVAGVNTELFSLDLVTEPEIAVYEGPDATGPERFDNAGTYSFGTQSAATARSFTLRNNGGGLLYVNDITINGANAASFFALGVPNPSLAIQPGGTATFTVTASLEGPPVQNAVVSILCNDSDEASFDIPVTVTVNDTVPPVISAPATWLIGQPGTLAMSLPNLRGIVAYTDNRPGDGTITQDPIPGDIVLGIGETATVTFTATDSAGNVSNTVTTLVQMGLGQPNTGDLAWARSGGVVGSEINVTRVAAMPDGGVAVAGAFSSSPLVLGTAGVDQVSLTTAGLADVFVARYDKDGGLLWAKRGGGTGTEAVNAITTLPDGSIVITGIYSTTAATFDGVTLTNGGGNDTYVARYMADGTLAWAKGFGGTGGDSVTQMIALSDGNIAIAGGYGTTTTITLAPGVTLVNQGSILSDLFLIKYRASDGTALWARSFGSSSTTESSAIPLAALPSGGVAFAAGMLSSTLSISGSATTVVNTGAAATADLLVSAFDGSGTLLWAKNAGGGASAESPVSLQAFSNGDVAVGGTFTSTTATFGSTSFTTIGSTDVFLLRLAASTGTQVWAKRIGGLLADSLISMLALPDDSLVLSGVYSGGSMQLGTGEARQTVLSPPTTASKLYLARFSGGDGTLRWAKTTGGTCTDTVGGLAILGEQDIGLAGSFTTPGITFGPGESREVSFTNLGSGSDVFAAKFSREDGSLIWAKRGGGTNSDSVQAVTSLPNGSLFVAGLFQPPAATFGAGESGETALSNVEATGTNTDLFFARFHGGGVEPPVAPLVDLLPASGISPSTLTFNAEIDSRGQQTSVVIEYGPTTAYGTSVPVTDVAAGFGTTNRSLSLSGLPPLTTLNFRVVATNAAGTTTSANQAITTFADAEITIEESATSLTDGTASISFGTVAIGGTQDRTFTIRNDGSTGTLTGLAITKDGAAAADYSVGALGVTSLLPGASTTFTVTFSPSVGGARAAAIHIFSNDGDESPFDIALSADNFLDAAFASAVDVPISSPGYTVPAGRSLRVNLGFSPAPGTTLMAISNSSNAPISGTFVDLPEGGILTASFGGQTVLFHASYTGGDGNDLVLTRQYDWTWVHGSNTATPISNYGTQGVASPANSLPGRSAAMTWTDATGNLWVFGGFSTSYLADLWRFNRATSQWTWVKGSNITNQNGIYGTQGVASTGNAPGSRQGGVTWIDSTGKLWLFGGFGYPATGTTAGVLNDLWRYDPATNNWTWISGGTAINTNGTYGTQGTAALTNVPGSRQLAMPWIDASNNLWLFGGTGLPATGTTQGTLNDLWKFDPVSSQWTWMKGASSISVLGTYGTLGTPGASNTPGTRQAAASWIDDQGRFWLFGGLGYGSNIFNGQLGDLWRYDPATNMWTWINGTASSTANQNSVYGRQGIASATNAPGYRYNATGWRDVRGRLWLFGGFGRAAAGTANAELSDLWNYDPATNQWTWVKGPQSHQNNGTYGTLGQPDAANLPGGRQQPNSFATNAVVRDIWLLGGLGFPASGTTSGRLNDLWVLDLPNLPSVTTTAATSIAAFSANANAAIIPDGTPTSLRFRYGTSPALAGATVTPWQSVGSSSTTGSLALNGLNYSTTYYFQAEVFNAAGASAGTILSFTTSAAPDIAIEQPAGTVLVNGASTISFGDASSANIASVTFTLKNVGTADLTGINASIIGASQADFSITALPTMLAAAGSTTFTVSLSPSALGARTGLLRIASNDNDENPFDIALQGNGVEALVAPVFLGTGGGTGSGTGSGVVNAPNSNGTGSLGRWESLRAGAVLSSNGRIAFRGFMEISSGSPSVTTNDFQGIWKHDGTDTRLKARSGTTAPDSSGAFFDMLPLNPSISPDGLISFYGTLRLATGSPQVTASTNQGLWSEIGGGNVRLLLRRGDTVVGGKTFRSGFAVSTSSVNTAALNTKLSTGSAMLHLDVNTPSVLLTVVAEEGQSAPGGGTWVALDGNSSDPRLSANGDLGFIGWELVGGSFIQGIYSRVRTTAVGTAGVSVQARMGGTATGTSGATFSAFERPTVFDGGMAFRGFLNRDGDNAAGARSQGVWSGAFGSLLPVVRTGDTSAQIATIPAGSAVTSVWSPFSNGVGSITMRVGLFDGASETRAILGNTGGTMRVIAKAGDAAPGLAGETFTNFDHPVIGDGDQVAFTASTNTGNYGIWKQAPGGGALSLVMKVGDSINTGTGNKVIADITVPGATSDDRKFEARCMDALGRMLIHVTFADGSTSLVLGL